MMIIARLVVCFYGTKTKTQIRSKTKIATTRMLVCLSIFFAKYTLENLLRYDW